MDYKLAVLKLQIWQAAMVLHPNDNELKRQGDRIIRDAMALVEKMQEKTP